MLYIILDNCMIWSWLIYNSFIKDVDECEEFQPCTNNGTCYNNDGSYVCDCQDGWLGQHCEIGTLKCYDNNIFKYHLKQLCGEIAYIYILAYTCYLISAAE